jgi:DNA (cytosine-5)-methyltransferase 1
VDLPAFNILSICSDVGGLELGIKLAVPNARVVCYVEGEAHAAAVLAARMQDKSLDNAPVWSDLRTFDGKPWRGKVDCIAGGYPCQPFSFAGKRVGADDPRHLWPIVAALVSDVRPSVCFFENVRGHLSLGFREVAADLQRMGYAVKAGLFSAAEVGATHNRERLFILACRTDGAPLAYNFDECDERRLRQRSRQRQPQETPAERDCAVGIFPPCPDDRDSWERVPETLKPSVLRMADGLANRLDRIRACGNGVVPLVAAYAWRTLSAGLELKWE